MKGLFTSLRFVLPIATILLHGIATPAVTFTNDTAIRLNDTRYDGLDIVVSNCTLTVDGAHSFASLQVLNGGNLTHTYAPGGSLENRQSITNEHQVLSTTNVATLSHTNVLASSIVVQNSTGLVTYLSGVDYVTGLDTQGRTTLLLTTNSSIANGSMNLVSYDFLGPPVPAGLSLTVAGDVTVAEGGTINADGRGYGGALGTGAGTSSGSPLSGSGAGHGGYGGKSAALDGSGMPYDSIQQPIALGSGGGAGYRGVGGAGGGSIKLFVGSNVRIDGTFSANGADGVNERSGGGSGGSIWIGAKSFVGTGLIAANGGAGEPSQGGGGGGGRILIQYTGNGFSGAASAYGGSGYIRGGAGTIYTRASTQSPGQVLVDNGGQSGAGTGLPSLEGIDLTVQGGAVISVTLPLSLRNLLVASNAWLSLSNREAFVSVSGNAAIQAGGSITADGAGFGGGQGTGAGKSDPSAYTAGGGGYGGWGAAGAGSRAFGGTTYGSVLTPTDLGSGGGSYIPYGMGGAGGGAIRLNITGVLILDGRITAEGSTGLTEGSGGGSGGSIWLTVGTLAGAGTISANGGMGNGFGLTGSGGGGGGGRIAIRYGTGVFFGSISAQGAGGSAYGGAGTIYTVANNQSFGLVLVDNGGQAGTNTSWYQTSTIDLTVRGGAVVVPPGTQTIGTLLVASNGWLRITNQVLTVTANATIQNGGGIIADGTGFPAGTGPGQGWYVATPSGYIGGGGGYGGGGAAGGAPAPYSAHGGESWGEITAPTSRGSGGGTYSTYAVGGAGGGAIRLTVTGVLQVYGTISAAGGAATTASGGGGSGGSVYLTVGTLSGSGVISANGGAGYSLGGGGGGGRIAVICGGYDFTGVVSAYGGGGYATGGAGTIYTKVNNQFSMGQVVADNCGQAGEYTGPGQAYPASADLVVKNGAKLTSYNEQTVGNLLVASNGWVIVANGLLTVTGNATIEAGCGIIADGIGSPAGQGTGAGRYGQANNAGIVGGGGGYGGYGASGGVSSAANGGGTYGSASEPTALGSGGGGPASEQGIVATGGAGGGAIHLAVAGTLQVNGRLSACGLAGTGPSAGGGSGGSIWLTARTLAGSGVISADGGAGNSLGGGGGGGRIVITVSSDNAFSGLMSAYGGLGYAAGGAGTIYSPGHLPGGIGSEVIVDNGGRMGTNTSWTGIGTLNTLIVRGGAILASSASQSVHNLVVGSNGWVVLTSTQSSVPTLTVTYNATVQAGGGIIADGTGYPAGQGQGAGRYASTSSGYVSSGGGYGGNGGSSGGTTAVPGGVNYGSATQPTVPGSGGGIYSTISSGGAGGGVVRLNVTGTLQVEGRISAAGGAAISPNFGGGSGGGILLTAQTLAGAGVISANGGAGNGLGGGGGGGRIALQYSTNAFSGVLSAYGGGGYTWGGAGTIYSKANNQNLGQLVVDNGGRAGTNTSWGSAGLVDLTVKGGAVVVMPSEGGFHNLLVASNGWLSLGTAMLTVSGNATVQAGGGIIADGTGYAGGQGPGAGRYASSTSSGYVGGGGGHGGFGATSGGATPGAGGSTYGSVTSQSEPGSGGGYPTTSGGGAGGGAIHMTVTGTLRVDGRVSANGRAGLALGSGGGSGGSVWLTAGTLAGTGVISANGGAGIGLGGGGGGGYVSLQYGATFFAGAISAFGGGGWAWGGAGTIYSKASSQVTGQMLVDNGGNYGTNTPLPYLSPFDLTVRGGAVAYPANAYLILSNLFINADGSFTCANTQTNLDVAVLRNATIDAGGTVTVDGKGFAPGSGPGAGLSSNSVGSGAGYGGHGGASSLLPGGATYGSAQQPVDRGSGGGFGYGTAKGGSEGGGAIRLTVGGILTLNGSLSAEGKAGLKDDAGGGSGGSIWLTVGALAGSGAIAADGGAGELYQGGGGGGGRIAIHTPFNGFGGLVSVAGGAGASPGQTGSIFYTDDPEAPEVISATPAGACTAAVSSADIVFNTPVNPYSVVVPNVGLTAPGGVMVSNIAAMALSPYEFLITFPAQAAQGDYTLTVGPQVEDLYGQQMSQTYTSRFSIILPVMPTLTTRVQANNLSLSWYGLQGVTYQTLYSTNLVDWLPYEGALQGTNGPLEVLAPIDAEPMKFFRVGASY
ncbi:MAG: hypothetical protein NT154_26520 [Verrucomicrobia bacterium]|nr:hypothetical protein [Verrucomicrobiota bacterium]